MTTIAILGSGRVASSLASGPVQFRGIAMSRTPMVIVCPARAKPDARLEATHPRLRPRCLKPRVRFGASRTYDHHRRPRHRYPAKG
jgi:hypothetical protein